MKPYDLVQVRPEYRDTHCPLPWHERFVFLGEINQMPGHGIFAVLGTGKIWCGFHTDQFMVVREEDL